MATASYRCATDQSCLLSHAYMMLVSRDCLSQNLKEIDWSTYWNPNLYVDNCAAQLKENIWYTVMFNVNMEAYIFERRRVSGKFNEKLELYQFPFDTQVRRAQSNTLIISRHISNLSLEFTPTEKFLNWRPTWQILRPPCSRRSLGAIRETLDAGFALE